MENKNLIGRVVYSKAGRDAKRSFIIAEVINENYVWIVDGDLRKLEKPKKKKMRHLILTDEMSNEIQQSIMCSNDISNLKIRRYLENREANKEG